MLTIGVHYDDHFSGCLPRSPVLEEMRADWLRGPDSYEIIASSPHRVHERCASRFRVGRALLGRMAESDPLKRQEDAALMRRTVEDPASAPSATHLAKLLFGERRPA